MFYSTSCYYSKLCTYSCPLHTIYLHIKSNVRTAFAGNHSNSCSFLRRHNNLLHRFNIALLIIYSFCYRYPEIPELVRLVHDVHDATEIYLDLNDIWTFPIPKIDRIFSLKYRYIAECEILQFKYNFRKCFWFVTRFCYSLQFLGYRELIRRLVCVSTNYLKGRRNVRSFLSKHHHHNHHRLFFYPDTMHSFPAWIFVFHLYASISFFLFSLVYCIFLCCMLLLGYSRSVHLPKMFSKFCSHMFPRFIPFSFIGFVLLSSHRLRYHFFAVPYFAMFVCLFIGWL